MNFGFVEVVFGLGCFFIHLILDPFRGLLSFSSNNSHTSVYKKKDDNLNNVLIIHISIK